MPTIEERLQALEQEHTQLKKTIELQTIAIGALVNKATLEKLNEKHDKIFDALMTHDRFTNQQLAELRTQQIETDGKVAGLQTEMRQRFNQQDGKVAGLQTEMRQHFNQQDGKVAGLQALQAEHTTHLSRLETKFDEQTKLLTQILERISKNDG
jgi:chromosome segregation ATPase